MVQIKNSITTFKDLNHFTLEYDLKEAEIEILMQMKSDTVTTDKLPHTFSVLEKFFPRVLQSQCFNQLHLPFDKEVKNTEIGHLFEHILIEAICQEKMARGENSVVVNGWTNWNWKKDPHGLFRISIDVGRHDFSVFHKSLKIAVELISLILGSEKSH